MSLSHNCYVFMFLFISRHICCWSDRLGLQICVPVRLQHSIQHAVRFFRDSHETSVHIARAPRASERHLLQCWSDPSECFDHVPLICHSIIMYCRWVSINDTYSVHMHYSRSYQYPSLLPLRSAQCSKTSELNMLRMERLSSS